jgi:hypothetical protein
MPRVVATPSGTLRRIPAPPPHLALRLRPYVSETGPGDDGNGGTQQRLHRPSLRAGLEIAISENWSLRFETAPFSRASEYDSEADRFLGASDIIVSPANFGFGLRHDF